MSQLAGKNVLITGAASGIGRIMARIALEKGAANLIIWDIDANALLQTVAELKGINANVHSYVVNLADVEQIKSAAQNVLNDLGAIDILINNAGIVVGKNFYENTHADITRTMMVNTHALMHVALEFLPAMMQRNSGHICNIASAAGLIAIPKMAVYCASKFAVTGWSESLRLELEQAKSNVKVTIVAPYYITTGMFEGVYSFIPPLSPEPTARRIIRGIERNKRAVRLPWLVNLSVVLKVLLPAKWFDVLVGRGFGIYKTMSTFKGRG